KSPVDMALSGARRHPAHRISGQARAASLRRVLRARYRNFLYRRTMETRQRLRRKLAACEPAISAHRGEPPVRRSRADRHVAQSGLSFRCRRAAVLRPAFARRIPNAGKPSLPVPRHGFVLDLSAPPADSLGAESLRSVRPESSAVLSRLRGRYVAGG